MRGRVVARPPPTPARAKLFQSAAAPASSTLHPPERISMSVFLPMYSGSAQCGSILSGSSGIVWGLVCEIAGLARGMRWLGHVKVPLTRARRLGSEGRAVGRWTFPTRTCSCVPFACGPLAGQGGLHFFDLAPIMDWCALAARTWHMPPERWRAALHSDGMHAFLFSQSAMKKRKIAHVI